MIYNIQI